MSPTRKIRHQLPACYLCNHKKPKFLFTKLGYDIIECIKCGNQYLNFSHQYKRFIKSYYNKGFFTGSSDRTGYANYEGDHLPEMINMKRYLQRISKFKSSGRLLDLGCATGIFMKYAQESGFSPFGADISEYAISLAKKRFPRRVQLSDISSLKSKLKSFDVITMLDVIEHLKTPREDLIHIKKFLKPDGLLVINTGDSSSLIAKLQQQHWHYYIPPQHLFFFSRKTLTLLLEQAGFEVIAIENKGKWLSIRYFLNLFRQIHQSKIADVLFKLVSNNPLGKIPIYLNFFDNILVYARIKSS